MLGVYIFIGDTVEFQKESRAHAILNIRIIVSLLYLPVGLELEFSQTPTRCYPINIDQERISRLKRIFGERTKPAIIPICLLLIFSEFF